jgi:hypothetical protein
MLMMLNMVGPLFFMHTLQAKMVLAATLAGAMLMMFIFSRYGFVRLMGLGHIFWIPVMIWIGFNDFAELSLETPFGIWLVLTMVCNTLSIILDSIDVMRYCNGDRDPMIPVEV